MLSTAASNPCELALSTNTAWAAARGLADPRADLSKCRLYIAHQLQPSQGAEGIHSLSNSWVAHSYLVVYR